MGKWFYLVWFWVTTSQLNHFSMYIYIFVYIIITYLMISHSHLSKSIQNPAFRVYPQTFTNNWPAGIPKLAESRRRACMEILEDIALEFRTLWTIHKATVTWMKLVLSVSVLMLLLPLLHRWCFLYALPPPKKKKSLCNLMAGTLFAHIHQLWTFWPCLFHQVAKFIKKNRTATSNATFDAQTVTHAAQ